ncbi:ABC transporter substrate-binding protein [Paenibacillus thermoaerophilus]|uniref:ABC transporter substrate-binding protein n=1 Tax=Paenibacillus thermoaerophilus TaxID=1215385 RepID=A0ABW2UXH7_9BACL|nr:iron-siderophore ABC transporter substrate-binding protein [Paenibacillus thermoaerophilus]TMV18994.1 iron-siderophore ABC transporter substrate-binding protein [Paenibacillus thermoaerophilus]
MKVLKGKLAGLSMLVLLLILSACGGGADTKTEGASASPSASPTAASQPEKRKVAHSMGESDVPSAPKRVVILTNEGLEALLALGVKPVGAVQGFTGNPWYDHLKSELDGVTNVGKESEPNIETIASLKPDLIIGNKMRHEKIYDQLKAIAPTVYSETLRGAWKQNFLFYSEAVNKKAEGEKIIADFDKRVDDIRSKLGDKINTKVSLVRFMPGDTRIYYKDTFAGIILEQIGFKRPDSQNKNEFAATKVPKERTPEMDGDIIFYFTYETGNGEASKLEEEWTKDPLWQNLSAVKAGKVVKVDDVIWNTAGGVKAAFLLLDDIKKQFGLS